MDYEEYMISTYIGQREPWEIDQAWEGMPQECCNAWPWRAWQLSPEAEHHAWLQWEIFVVSDTIFARLLNSF